MEYSNKTSDYFSNIRLDLIDFANFNKNDLKILEIGAAYCETLNYLKIKGVAKTVVGIDIYEDVKNKNLYKEVDQMLFGDIEDIDLTQFNDFFDVILLADVLEHLVEPTKVLEKIKSCLNQDGVIVVSMPNIRHFSAFIKIFIKGSFKYEQSGIFDSTHMRFYCRKDIEQLLESCNFEVINQAGSITGHKSMSKTKILNLLTLGLFTEFFSYQYFFKAKKRR